MQLNNLSGTGARLERAIVSFLVLSVDGGIIEHRWWRGLSSRHLAQRLVICFEQGKNHRRHLPGDPSDHAEFPTIVLRTFIVDRQTWKQALIDACPLTLQGDGPANHEKKHLLHGTDPSLAQF